MKAFFRNHSYNMVKMFLNQFATAIFGFSLCLASGYAKNYALRNITSVASILFYMFLLYVMTWELGFKERIAVEGGRIRRAPWKGMLIALCANIPNFILAILIALAHLFPGGAMGNVGAFSAVAAILLQGQYMGILAHPVAGVALHSMWWIYFLTPIPAILCCGLSYWMGLLDKKLTGISDHVYPESDREARRKRWGRPKD